MGGRMWGDFEEKSGLWEDSGSWRHTIVRQSDTLGRFKENV
jgi:hypothetical protein